MNESCLYYMNLDYMYLSTAYMAQRHSDSVPTTQQMQAAQQCQTTATASMHDGRPQRGELALAAALAK
jgi:hypothetical protein